MATKKVVKKVDKRTGPKDSRWVSSQESEMRTISQRFIGYKTGENIPVSTLYSIYFAMKSNVVKVERKAFYQILDIMGYGRNPQLDER